MMPISAFLSSPCCSSRNLIASIGSGISIGKCASSYASTRVVRISRRSPSGVPSSAPHKRSIARNAASWSDSVLMGFNRILNNPHVDCVVFLVGSQPFDEYNGPPIVHGDYESIGVSFDVEDDSLRSHNARIGIARLHRGCILPLRSFYFVKPGIECCFYRALIFVSL